MTSRFVAQADRRLPRRMLAMAAAAVLVASCTGNPASQAPSSPSATLATSSASASPVARGGTLRVVVPALTGGTGVDGSAGLREQPALFLDPQLDGYGTGSFSGSPEIGRCCLTRTLLSYNGLSTEHGGAELRPDLAAALPDVSADGLTWTFRIKPGLHYGPPLQDVEITARDFIRSISRLYSPTIVSPWALLADIQGAADYSAGKAASISGLEPQDDHTLVIRLTSPAGDLAAQLALPATTPLPPDPLHPDAPMGIAEGADTGYGRFLVSSGPYMLEGSEALDFSVPAAQRKEASGIAPGRITLVRNPSWDASSDPLRPAYADRIEITSAASVAQAVADLDAGRADLVWPAYGPSPSIPADLFTAFQRDPNRGQAHLDALALVRTVVMNVAVPPFDDMHVRKALNLALDKQHLIDLQGGPVAQLVANHIAPDSAAGGLLLDYRPYATPGDKGDMSKALAEMAKATYATDADGRCAAPACTHVRAVTRDPYGPVAAAVADDLRALGIDLDVQVLDSDAFFAAIEDPKAKVPLAIGLGYNTGYISATGLLSGFDGPQAFFTWNGKEIGNTAMVGATADQLRRWGYEVTDVPNVDKRVEACLPLVASAQSQCWAKVDQYLMEYVVPWVPYSQDRYAALTSPLVLTYGFDELVGTTSLDQLALKP